MSSTRVNGLFSNWAESQTANFQLQSLVCFNPTNTTVRSWSTHSQGSYEQVNHDLEILWAELEQILQLKIGLSKFGSVRD